MSCFLSILCLSMYRLVLWFLYIVQERVSGLGLFSWQGVNLPDDSVHFGCKKDKANNRFCIFCTRILFIWIVAGHSLRTQVGQAWEETILESSSSITLNHARFYIINWGSLCTYEISLHVFRVYFAGIAAAYLTLVMQSKLRLAYTLDQPACLGNDM